ncbi:YlaI family protein [Pullulanibacillus sp. KACC 23026]|uniref:YlaI family protein n=1 Tax=Pullulanibacillus sp. KACC 23026 TaxID=3028315 RepID=UPI0023B0AD68|nr:YlaI family protein [Pullulanibacillus sp. KACC 23026]WEG15010.1 YlaI family protein [Pullulanibacillus sp. KACC 23026]
MKITCILCQETQEIDDQNPVAKRLRNRPIHTYMCPNCHERITDRTIKRWETGKFRVHHKEVQKNDQW